MRPAALLAIPAAAAAACSLLTDTTGFVTGEAPGDGGQADVEVAAPIVDGAADDAREPVTDAAADTSSAADGDGGSTYAAIVLMTAGLEGYWRFDEKSGTQVSPTRSTITGTISGDVAVGSPGLIVSDPSTAFTFASSGTGLIGLQTGFPFPGKAAFSVELWHKPTAINGYQELVTRHLANIGGWVVSVDASKGYQLYRESASTGASVMTSYVPALGSVNHVVATFDGATHRVYVNGVLRGTPNTDTSFDLPNNSTTLRVGLDVRGVVDEVAIYDVALALPTIQAHYAAGGGN